MATLNVYLGKGIKETSGEFREYFFWGAPLGCPDWPSGFGTEAVPEILYESNSFDFTSEVPRNLSPYHEALGLLTSVTGASGGKIAIRHQFYRKEGEEWILLWEHTSDIIDESGWITVWCASFTGWVPNEFDRNGNYKWVVSVLYDYSYLSPITKEFTITGIEAPTAVTRAATSVGATTATLNGVICYDGGEDCQYRFRYKKGVGGVYSYTPWTGAANSEQDFWENISGLDAESLYYFNAQARNSTNEGDWGGELSFTTLAVGEAIPGYVWIEGTDLHYIDEDGSEQIPYNVSEDGTGVPGYVWIETQWIYYIDSSGNKRSVARSGDTYSEGHTPGYIWVEGTAIHYIGSDGREYSTPI